MKKLYFFLSATLMIISGSARAFTIDEICGEYNAWVDCYHYNLFESTDGWAYYQAIGHTATITKGEGNTVIFDNFIPYCGQIQGTYDEATSTITFQPQAFATYYTISLDNAYNQDGYLVVTPEEFTAKFDENHKLTFDSWAISYNNGCYAFRSNAIFEYIAPRTVTIASDYPELGTVAFTAPENAEGLSVTTKSDVTIEATAIEPAVFINWTDANGKLVTEKTTYTYTEKADTTFIAHFGYLLNYSVNEGGKVSFTTGDTPLRQNSKITPGMEITATFTPDDGMHLEEVKVNGEPRTVTDNTLTLTVDGPVNIEVTFAYDGYSFTLLTEGNGEVQAWTDITDSNGPGNGTRLTTGSSVTPVTDIFLFMKPAENNKIESIAIKNGEITETESGDKLDWLDDNEEYYVYLYSGVEGNVSITVTFAKDTAAIESITADDSENTPAEYFNLQGIKVSSENLAPGLYIVRQGSKVSKTLVK